MVNCKECISFIQFGMKCDRGVYPKRGGCIMFHKPEKKYYRSITYEPKIPAVRDGRCTQSIRIETNHKVGDIIVWHGWEGKPYRSKWSWRLETELIEEISILIMEYGIVRYKLGMLPRFFVWEDLDYLAKLDFIDPPTGLELKRVLFEKNKNIVGKSGQILRWKIIDLSIRENYEKLERFYQNIDEYIIIKE